MIARTAFERILKEYEEKQLLAQARLDAQRARIEAAVPRLAEIEAEMAHLSVTEAIARISGGTKGEGFSDALARLQEEKEAVLQSAGYSLADLQPQFECEKCKDTGFVDNAFCMCLKNRITDTLYDQSRIKEILKEENFANFSYAYYKEASHLAAAKAAVNTACDFIRRFDSSASNLFITGTTGVGKTFLTNCIAKELIDRGYFVVYLSAIRLFDILSNVTFGQTKSEAESSFAEFEKKHIFGCDLLIIDDLGTEMVNSFTKIQLFDCINERILAKKHTIISTNLSMHRVQELYTERISSRIADKYTFVRLQGNDIRMMKNLEEK